MSSGNVLLYTPANTENKADSGEPDADVSRRPDQLGGCNVENPAEVPGSSQWPRVTIDQRKWCSTARTKMIDL
ncbi:hypothetical protein PMZ80_004346 [Knufia obscura]|uniref:Uncharacterized protein n=1 Tax=Knufia obscura TaxID=1635080 RepID=A0ABR0RSY7_9EURO|nr:hypothetical protein PMZ80_004346 [Knufia obscura]